MRPTRWRLPRVREDRPHPHCCRISALPATPRARRSTLCSPSSAPTDTGYPACAGIDPAACWLCTDALGLPRVRGDRPEHMSAFDFLYQATPRARGSTHRAYEGFLGRNGYPACAGIDPRSCRPAPCSCRLPRVRGDRPSSRRAPARTQPATPRARGSTCEEGRPVGCRPGYPACAGIDPTA